MCGALVMVGAEEDGDYCVADSRADGADEQDGFAAGFVDVEDLMHD